MRICILGGTKTATSGVLYLWVKSLQANWELGGFSPVRLENLVGNNFTCCASKCASSGSQLVSEDVRQRKPYAGLLVLDTQKNRADKILFGAHPKRNLWTTISGLKHVLRDVRPELNPCFQGSKPLMGCNRSRWITSVARPNVLSLGL